MTRRFDIGPFVLALGAIAASGRAVPRLVRRAATRGHVFEIADVLLAALAVAGVIGRRRAAHA